MLVLYTVVGLYVKLYRLKAMQNVAISLTECKNKTLLNTNSVK